jgi:membrane protease subunit HflC
MQKPLRIFVALVVLLAILAFMMTFTVRFTEAAVVTTFGRATERDVIKEAGLNFKMPFPIQSVTKYDTRQRYVETRSETLATADNRQVILQSYIVWRVVDPLRFFQSYGNVGSREDEHVRAAEELLRAKLRSALAETSQFKLTDLLTTDAGGSKLPELEARVLAAITSGAGSSALAASGIEAVVVGINSMELPESVTEQVFKQMEAQRRTIAGKAANEGTAAAATIRNSGEESARKIRSFAERRADAIRGQADSDSAPYLALQSKDPRLAVFLQNIRFMRDALSKRTTLVLPTSLPGLHLLDPSIAEKLGQGQIPEPRGVGETAENKDAKPADEKGGVR